MSNSKDAVGCFPWTSPTTQADLGLVKELSKSRHSSVRLSMLLVTLGVCVFLWGLGYKLSLYDFHRASIHRIPDAKLLSRNEDPNATDSTRLCLVNSSTTEQDFSSIFLILIVSLAIVAKRKSPSDRQYLALSKPWCHRFTASLSALFLRPPPVLSAQ